MNVDLPQTWKQTQTRQDKFPHRHKAVFRHREHEDNVITFVKIGQSAPAIDQGVANKWQVQYDSNGSITFGEQEYFEDKDEAISRLEEIMRNAENGLEDTTI